MLSSNFISNLLQRELLYKVQLKNPLRVETLTMGGKKKEEEDNHSQIGF